MQEYVLYADDGVRMHEYLFGSDKAGICFSYADEAGICLSCVYDVAGINALF
jgi:hypothetical protein